MYTFDPDSPTSPVWDIDDVLILQKMNGEDQESYDHPSISEDSWVFPIYFDRDGVTPYQTTNPQCIDGTTYNTQGEYRISLIFDAVDETHGIAYMIINDQIQGYILGTDPYPPLDTQPEIEIIVDDPEATYIGDWFPSTWVPGYYGDGYTFHWAGDGTDTFTWTFDLPYQGTWEVYAMWSNRTDRAANSPYTINHAEGADTIRVNQEINGGEWNSLGTYTFNEGETTIVLSDDADQFVIADAIKLELKEISWPTISHSPAGISFMGDMKNMKIFYQLESLGADHVVAFKEMNVKGCLTSLQLRKEQTIEDLTQTDSEEKKIEHRIDKMIDKIEKSLDEKLWLDDYTLTLKHGKKVFDNEKKAVKHGMKILKDKKTTEEVKEVVKQVIDELVSVDLNLAENALRKASQYCGTKKGDHELEKANKYLQQAYEELGKSDGKYDKVIKNLKKSWEHSQKALKHAEKQKE